MKKLLVLFALFVSTGLLAQQGERQHQLVLQMSSNDTMEVKMLMRQLKNLNEASPTTRIEVVCHGPGLDLLMSERSFAPAKVKEFTAKGIRFLACENTMRDRNVDKAQLLPETSTVPAAIIHIMERQEDGWSYIKAGF